MIGGTVLIAVIVVALAIVVSTSGGSKTSKAPSVNSASAKASSTKVSNLLAGIPQAGNRLGSPTAKVTITEYGDLQCPVCKDFATGAEEKLISNEVKSGKAQLLYRSLCTATCNGPTANMFTSQQAAAGAAGLQAKEWNYVMLFYNEQGAEGSSYVNDSYLNGLASQIPGLTYAKWSSDRTSSTLTSQVTSDQQQASAAGFNSTPTIVVQGPKGEAQPIVGDTDYGTLQSAINQVS